jgi:hypothetical protein
MYSDLWYETNATELKKIQVNKEKGKREKEHISVIIHFIRMRQVCEFGNLFTRIKIILCNFNSFSTRKVIYKIK